MRQRDLSRREIPRERVSCIASFRAVVRSMKSPPWPVFWLSASSCSLPFPGRRLPSGLRRRTPLIQLRHSTGFPPVSRLSADRSPQHHGGILHVYCIMTIIHSHFGWCKGHIRSREEEDPHTGFFAGSVPGGAAHRTCWEERFLLETVPDELQGDSPGCLVAGTPVL